MESSSSQNGGGDKNRKKSSTKKLAKSASLDSDRQQRRDVRRLQKLLKKYDLPAFQENQQTILPDIAGNSSLTANAAPGTVASTSSQVSGAESHQHPLRIIRANSSELFPNQNQSANGGGHSQNRRKKDKSHHRPRIERRHSELQDLRRYLGSAFKNSLNHMHDHIIATLPTEMSLYYQKLHDTLLFNPEEGEPGTSGQQQQHTAQTQNRSGNGASNDEQMKEMHEFISAETSGVATEAGTSTSPLPQATAQKPQSGRYPHGAYNPYAPPSPKHGLPIRDFLNDPLNASLSTLNRVTNLVRVPTTIYHQGYNILNTLANPVNLHDENLTSTSDGKTRAPGMAERVTSGRPTVPLPPPVLPLIQCTLKQTRLEPLGLEEFESKPWTVDSLRQRVYNGGVSDQLRLRLWPFILGLSDDDYPDEIIQDVRHKEFNWSEREKLFEHYRSQWRAILPDQERRFMLFRERKSLIERDVIRCDRTHSFYHGDNNPNLDKLKQLLLTYMMYDFDTGYVQGMSDLASPLLYVAQGDVCKAFWFFVKTMEFTNNNFEMSQLTIKHQLEMLWKLIELTDPIFAQYLANNDSVNCYFAFRWIVCQFKREFMKSNSDDYQEVLLLWESIWTCSAMKKYFLQLKKNSGPEANKKHDGESPTAQVESESQLETPNPDFKLYPRLLSSPESDETGEASNLAKNLSDQCKIDESIRVDGRPSSSPMTATTPDAAPILSSRQSSSSLSSELNNEDNDRQMDRSEGRRLSDTELYVLCICLSIIRRERDLIMAQRYDATEILKHFNTLHLTNNLKNILIHAANIWSWLIHDGNEKLLYGRKPPNGTSQSASSMAASASAVRRGPAAGTPPAVTGANQSNPPSSSNNDAEDFDLLQDLRMPLDSHSFVEEYLIMNDNF